MKKQHGAILILTLVILLMLSFYGIVSTRDAKTQLQIVGNSQLYSQALASAEGTLTKAENTINCLLETCTVNDSDADGVSDCDDEDTIDLLREDYPLMENIFSSTGNLNADATSTLTSLGCIDVDYLSSTDMTQNQIQVTLQNSDISICGEGLVKDADGISSVDNQRTRIETFEISVQSNELKRGHRRVKSSYVVVSEEWCT